MYDIRIFFFILPNYIYFSNLYNRYKGDAIKAATPNIKQIAKSAINPTITAGIVSKVDIILINKSNESV